MKLFKNTVELLRLTKNCSEDDRRELLGYISQLENQVEDFHATLESLAEKKSSLESFIKK